MAYIPSSIDRGPLCTYIHETLVQVGKALLDFQQGSHLNPGMLRAKHCHLVGSDSHVVLQ